MSWRNKTSGAIATAAAHIGLGPAKLFLFVAGGSGPDGLVLTALSTVFSMAITAPVTLPMLIMADLIREKK